MKLSFRIARWAFVALWVGTALPVGAQPAVAPAPSRFVEVVDQARALLRQDWAEKGYPGIAIAVSVEGETV